MNTTPTRRTARGSVKRLKLATNDALLARRKIEAHIMQNSFKLIKLIEAAELTSAYQSIQFHEITGSWHAPCSPVIAELLGVSEIELANDSIVEKHFKILWNRRFEGKTHEACKVRALADLQIPAWSHLTGTDVCPCCARKLACEHKNIRSIPQAECYSRNIYHAGRCYHVSECLDCGEVSAVDSSD